MALQAAVQKCPRRQRVRMRLGQAVPHGLLGGEAGPEGLALAQVVPRPLHGGLHGGHRGDGHQQPLLRQLAHHDAKAAAFRAQQILQRNAHVGEEQLGGVLRMHAHLVEVAAAREPRPIGRHQQQADSSCPLRQIGLAGQQHQIRDLAVGNEQLLAIDAPVGAIALGPGADGSQVAAGAGLRHADGPDHFTPRHRRQPGLLLLLRAVVQQVRGDYVGVEIEQRAGGPGARHFFHHDRAVAEVDARAAILLGQGETQQAELTGAPPEFARHLAVALPSCVKGHDVLGDEAPHGVAEFALLRCLGARGNTVQLLHGECGGRLAHVAAGTKAASSACVALSKPRAPPWRAISSQCVPTNSGVTSPGGACTPWPSTSCTVEK